jgi:hypothetical protein
VPALIRLAIINFHRIVHIKFAVKLNNARRPEFAQITVGEHFAVILPAVKQIVGLIGVHPVMPRGVDIVSAAAFDDVRVCLAYVIILVNLK